MTGAIAAWRLALALLCAATPRAADAARPAAEFLDGIGVNVHLGARDTGYRDVEAVARKLAYLGVRKVRADLLDVEDLAPYRRLGAQGIRFDLIVMTPPEDAMPALRALAPYLGEIEGPNEVNVTPVLYAGQLGDPGAVALQRALYRMVKADATLRRIPVINFSVAQGGGYGKFGDMSGAADYTNVHAYAEHGVPPFWMLKPVIDGVTDTPGRPAMVTEIGNYTLPDGKSGVSETVQAKWLLDALLDAFRDKARATYVYELQDERPDPDGRDPERHYGLFRANGDPKPAATALHNLNAILSMRGKSAANVVPVRILPLDPPLFQLTFALADGGQDTVIWAEPDIWDYVRKAERPTPSHPVDVEFVGRTKITIYDPLAGAAPIREEAAALSVRLDVTDHPIILHAEPFRHP